MANIILKDKNGTDITHMGIDYLCMRTLEGGLVRFNEGDIRVISVDELPSENIKEDAIYKVSATDEDGNAKVVFYTYADGEWTEYKVGKDPVFENLEITENGTYTPAEGVDGWSEVTVNVESNPVLTELVVTENGVYDEPVIGGGAVEIAVGKTVTFKKNLPDVPIQNSGGKSLRFYNEAGGWTWMMMAVGNYSYVILGEGDYVGGFPMSTYEYVTESVALSGEDPFFDITTAGWHKLDFTAEDMTISPCDPPSITIQDGRPMTGTTNIEMLTLLADFIFEAPSTPADGWNKVTVNVEAKPVLAELVVTENGVYDEPMIGGGAPDFTVGNTVQFRESYAIDDFPAEVINQPNLANIGGLVVYIEGEGSMFVVTVISSKTINGEQLDGTYCYLSEEAAPAVGGNLGIANAKEGWYLVASNGTAPIRADAPPSVIVKDEEYAEVYTNMSFFFAGPLVPADGWNKVTVNVPVNEPPVLAELVVTENGVYDEPMINNTPEPITWDGVVGDKVTVDVGNGMTFVKVSDKALSAEDLVGATVVLLNTSTVVLTNEMISSVSGGVVLPELTAVSVSDVEAFSASMGVSFPENGTYFVYSANTGVYTESITFPPAPPTPADAWNKVTVNVAGDIIDVDELPTENVDDSKIYRTTETTDPSVEIYVYIPDASDSPMTVPEYLKLDGVLFDINIEYHIVDSVPLASEMLLPDQETYTYHVYVVLETGEDYATEDGTTVVRFMDEIVNIPQKYFVGTVHGLGEMTQMGYYFLVTEGSAYSVYGLPNSNADKKFYEYNSSTSGWEECDSGERLMVDVLSFPTENIDDTKVYRIKTKLEEQLDVVAVSESDGPMTMSDMCNIFKNFGYTASVNYYVVDELPSSPVISLWNDESKIIEFHIYILQDTGEPYVSTDGTTCVYLGESGIVSDGEYFGIINDIDKATATGYYTLICKEGFKYSYGVSNTADNKRLFEYDGEWKDTSAVLKGEIENLNVEIENLNTEVDTLTNENETLTNRIPSANFTDYAVLSISDYGIEASGTDESKGIVGGIKIPNGVMHLGNFYGHSSLTSVIIPDSVKTIAPSAFTKCTGLTSVTFGSGIEQFGINAFDGCTSMQYYDFTSCTAVPELAQNVFKGIPSTCEIRVPAALVDEWKVAQFWSTYASYIVGV